MEASLYVPLKEQENLKKLFQLMDEHGLKEEKKQVLELACYIDSMEGQFKAVLEELGSVKEQLGQIQDKGFKNKAIKVVNGVERKVQDARRQFYVVKAKFMAGVSQAVDNFKEKGVTALYKSLDVLGIKRGLIGLKERLCLAIESADLHIDRLGTIGDELHEVKIHLGNAGRSLMGKEPKASGIREVEKGAVYQVQKSLYYMAGMLKKMEKRTDTALKKVLCLEEKASVVKRPSVRESLKALESKEQSKEQSGSMPEKHQETSRIERELR